MLTLALSVALLIQDEPARLRTICRNGAAVIVERMAESPSISVQLWASSRSVNETPDTHGWRHLLEHLAARGQGGGIDRKLETEGGYLRARTFRDAIQFEVVVGPGKLDVAMQTLRQVLTPIQTTQEAIDREVQVMRQEFAILDNAARMGGGAWRTAYGEHGLDPLGSIGSIAKATPKDLQELHRKLMYPENLVLSIAGPVDIKAASELGVESIGMKQGAIRLPDPPPPPSTSGRSEVEGFGDARAGIVSGFDRPQTMASLAFALSVASEVDGAFVSYTPATIRGLVVVGQTETRAGLGLKIDSVSESDFPRMFALGRLLTRNWVQRYLRSASGTAMIRGLLLVQNHASRPENMLAAIDAMTLAQFKEAAQSFSKEKGVSVVGI